ncbi:MAG: recombinase family protein [Clostridium sp.]|uniref:recombinase family protein n=1 Tax=Clostridium sp. TaxID=1506 RepID=UPI003F2DF396
MNKIKSCLYCRVSTTHNEQETSYELQHNFNNEQFIIEKIYGERTTGRFLKKRPVMREMLSDCGIEITFNKNQPVFIETNRKSLYENIIVANTSRFGRNLVEVKQIIEMLHKKEVTIWFDDIGKFSNATDLSLTLDLLFLLDENYSKQVQSKVLYGLERARKEKGYLHLNSTFFGMEYLKGKNRLIPNEQSKIVVNIFNEYKNGASMRNLANKYGKTQSRIKDIIDNPRYAGYNFYGIYVKDGTYKRKGIENVKIYESDRIEPIISIDLWRECQEIKKSRKCGARGINNGTYALSSKIICAKCGTKFFHKQSNRKPNSDLWKCRKSHNEPHLCDMVGISEKTIIRYLKSYYGLSSIRNTLSFKIQLAIDNIKVEDKETLEFRIKPLNDKMKRLKKLFLMGDITEEEYQEMKSEFKNELDKLNVMLANVQNKELNIIKLKKLKKDYNKILDEYEVLLEGNPQELFKRISYIKVDKMNNVITNKYNSYITEVMFKDFQPIKEYYGQFIILDEK